MFLFLIKNTQQQRIFQNRTQKYSKFRFLFYTNKKQSIKKPTKMKIIIFSLLIILIIAQQDQLVVQQPRSSYLSTIPSLRKAAYQYKIQAPQQGQNQQEIQIVAVSDQVKVVDESLGKDVKGAVVGRVNSPTRVQHIVPVNQKNNDKKGQQFTTLQQPQILLPQQQQQQQQILLPQQQEQPQPQILLPQQPQIQPQIILPQQPVPQPVPQFLIKTQPQFKPQQKPQPIIAQRIQQPREKRQTKQLRSADQFAQIQIYGKPIVLQPQPQQFYVNVNEQKPTLLSQQTLINAQNINNNNNRQQFAIIGKQQQQQQKRPTGQQLIYGTQFPNLGQLKNWNVNQLYVAPAHSQ